MAGPFAGAIIFSCEDSNGGVHGELLVVKCGAGNQSGIVRGSGCVLGWLCGYKVREVIQGNVW